MLQYRPATIKDGFEVAKNLRTDDLNELLGMGYSHLHVPFGVATSSHATTFFTRNGDLAGVAGVNPESNGQALVWMVCTPAIHNEVFTFVRQAKHWLSEVETEYSLLWNLADARNHMHHKLLRHLGFKALRAVPVGPKQLPYFEIVKLCA